MASPATIWAFADAGTQLAAVGVRAADLHQVHGLEAGEPLSVAATTRTAGAVQQQVTEAGGAVVVERAP
jgi:hypothetical protein